MSKTLTPETNHISSPKTIQTEQPVAQKPMSIEQYTQALRKEAEVAKLRASIAKSMFEETMAMVQLQQLKAGQFGPPKPPQEIPQEVPIEDPSETTEIE